MNASGLNVPLQSFSLTLPVVFDEYSVTLCIQIDAFDPETVEIQLD